MADTKIEKELHIMNGLLKDIRDELRKMNKPQTGCGPDMRNYTNDLDRSSSSN